KALGPRAATKGGVGSWAASGGDIVVGALVVLNAVGNILDGSGAILAGARGADGTYVDALAHFARGAAPFGAVAARNTTLAVVATNATLDRTTLESLAQAAGDALARRIVPYGTLFDGDVVFAVSTAAATPATPLQAEALAGLAVPIAVERGVAWRAARAARAARRGRCVAARARRRRLPCMDPRWLSGRGTERMGRGLEHAGHRTFAGCRAQVRGSAPAAGGGRAGRAASQRAGRDRRWMRLERDRGGTPAGIGGPSRSAPPRAAGVGPALVEPSVDYVCDMKLVLFDIDGTLLWTDGAGRRAIQRALLDEAGTAGPIETYRFDGKTDPQIVRDLLSLAGYADADNA